MSERQIPSDPELTEIETALGALAPSKSRIDRDRLMFVAGKASSRSASQWAWPSIAAALMAVATGEGVALVSRPEPRVVERLVIVREPETAELAPVTILSQEPEPVPRPGLTRRWFDPDAVLKPTRDFDPRFTASAPPEPSGSLLRTEIAKLLHPGDSS